MKPEIDQIRQMTDADLQSEIEQAEAKLEQHRERQRAEGPHYDVKYSELIGFAAALAAENKRRKAQKATEESNARLLEARRKARERLESVKETEKQTNWRF